MYFIKYKYQLWVSEYKLESTATVNILTSLGCEKTRKIIFFSY